MAASEIDVVRALLRAKPRPIGWAARRERLDEVGAQKVGADISLETETHEGLPLEWSLAPGGDPSRVLLFFHGGGYCSGSIQSHRGMVTAAGRAAAGGRSLSATGLLRSIHFQPRSKMRRRPMNFCSRGDLIRATSHSAATAPAAD